MAATEAEKRRAREWYAANRDQARSRQTAYYAATADQQADARLRKQYGIGLADYDEMLNVQQGTCALCPATERDRRGGRLHVDHCHTTGRVRGLLCGACNQAIGKFEDDPARLRAAADYLERST